MRDYKKLQVWQKAYSLGVEIYKVTKLFPKEEIYGLTSQLRRSAVSIPSNIAEGSRRSTEKDYKSFLYIAYGSVAELEVQIMYAEEFGYVTSDVAELIMKELSEISRMLNSFIQKLS